LASEDFHGVVLDPTLLRVELLELVLRSRGNRSRIVKKNRAGTGRPLVQCKNVWHLIGPPSPPSQSRGAGLGQGGVGSSCEQICRSPIWLEPIEAGFSGARNEV
jgi:hypothetical protein